MIKSADEIIEETGKLVKGVWAHKENTELLSKDLNDISVLNWALSQYHAEFEEQERQMKAELDLEKANLMLSLIDKGEAVNKSEIRVTIQTGEKRKLYNKMASAVEKMKITGRATEKVMDAARSRLALIRGEVK